MRIETTCDMNTTHDHKAKDGIDVEIYTESQHCVTLCVREHGMRLWIDGKEQENIDFAIPKA